MLARDASAGKGVPPMPNSTASGKRVGPAPRKEPAYPGPSPFSSVLAEYMWQSRDTRNRPLGVGQLAIRLGVPRPTLNTWVHRNVVPDLEIVLAVLRTLNIPVERLFAHYRAAGLPVPPLTEAEANANTNAGAQVAPPPTAATAAQQRAVQPPLAPTTPTPEPTPAPTASPAANPDPWEDMIASTTDSLRQYGVPEAAIAATLANIRATQAGQPHALQHHVTAEHAESEPERGEGEPKQQPRGPSAKHR